MRVVLKEDYLKLPDDVKVSVKARRVTVKGPLGELTRAFNHLPIDIRVIKMATSKMKGLYVRIQMWNGGYKQACAVTTFKSLISNCFIGVTEGFRYRMKMVHAHFPITAIISKDKSQIEIKNFLGGKKSHLIKMQPGCTVQLNPSKDVKNELVFEGIDNAAVSLCCAQVSGVCFIKQKDERKFLDGIFVSAKELIEPK